MGDMEFTFISTSIHTPEISCLIFQTLYERDGVYIHINVNTHTSDRDAHLPGRMYLLQKVSLYLINLSINFCDSP